MLPYITEAKKMGYGVIIPNARNGGSKDQIPYSNTPAEHMTTIWDKYVAVSNAAKSGKPDDGVVFLSYDEGSNLVRNVIAARVQDITRTEGRARVHIKGIVLVEPNKSYDTPVPGVEALMQTVAIEFRRIIGVVPFTEEEAQAAQKAAEAGEPGPQQEEEVVGYTLNNIGQTAVTCTLPARPIDPVMK
jgi:hypothetical protein